MRPEAIGVADIGASGGRFSVLVRDGRGYALQTVHEFSHPLHELRLTADGGPVQRRLVWNPLTVYEGICDGIRRYARSGEAELVSFGLDSWGSDGVWVNRMGDMLTPACASRCGRYDGAREELERLFPGRERFTLSGTYPDPHVALNSIYWATATIPQTVEAAHRFLPLVSLYDYWLCGEQAVEYTWATTGQLVDGRTGAYCDRIFDRLQLPREKLPPLRKDGGVLGRVHSDLAEDLGTGRFAVMLQPHHDTACAFAVAGTEGVRTMIISAGSWWCLGVPLDKPLITEGVYAHGFTNVGGAQGVILNKVMPGGVLADHLRRAWEREDGKALGWEAFNRLAESGYRPDLDLDIDDPRLAKPADIPRAVAAVAGLRRGSPEAGRERLAALVYMGLARKAARLAATIGTLTGEPVEEILVIGGGSRNHLLNQWLAGLSGLPVRTGPDNATTLGNAICQARALGWFGTLAEAREAVRPLWREKIFMPNPTGHDRQSS